MCKKRLLAGQMIEMQVKVIRIVEFIGIPRSSFYYKSCYDKDKDKELTEKIKEIAYKYSFYGYRRVYRAVRENGFMVNHKKVYRIYKSLSLQKPVKKRRKCIPCDFPFSAAEKKNSVWATDFISDSLVNGRKFRIMVVEDIYSRMVVVCLIAESIRSSDVISGLQEAIAVYGKPQAIRSDNGPEYISRSLGAFLSQERITHERIEKGKPASEWLC
jgi:putative transposase